jgi:hypothetical protein
LSKFVDDPAELFYNSRRWNVIFVDKLENPYIDVILNAPLEYESVSLGELSHRDLLKTIREIELKDEDSTTYRYTHWSEE